MVMLGDMKQRKGYAQIFKMANGRRSKMWVRVMRYVFALSLAVEHQVPVIVSRGVRKEHFERRDRP